MCLKILFCFTFTLSYQVISTMTSEEFIETPDKLIEYRTKNSNLSPIVLPILGESVSQKEVEYFQRIQPLGWILFKDNCKSKEQVKSLISQLKALVKHDPVILIDQEGGRVQRLVPPIWKQWPSFGELSKKDIPMEEKRKLFFEDGKVIGAELFELGITYDCAPLCDLLFNETSQVIGDRSIGNDPNSVIILATEWMNGLISSGVRPIMKHVPGHGRATVDTHESLPIVKTEINILKSTDFLVFKEVFKLTSSLNPWMMVAHIVFEEIDKLEPASRSKTIIDQVIRDFIGFDGVLITDALEMKALSGTMIERIDRALNAGIDVALYCDRTDKELKVLAEIADYFERK